MSQYAQEFLDRTRPYTAVITGDDGHLYGVRTSQVAATTVSKQLLGNDNNRVSWTFCNYGTGIVFVSWSPPASNSRDFPIFANGGVLETSQIDDKNVARMPVYVIANAASDIAIIEVVKID